MSRRPGGAARAGVDEVVRSDLLDALSHRWDRPVTTLVAGPGFGKSTALAQAVRVHLAAPRGHEALVRCDAGSEQGPHLAGLIVEALRGIPPRGRESGDRREQVTRIVETLQSSSPLPVCLILDDVHELPPGSSGAELLAALVGELPANAHLVLSGRRLPDLPLARLEAADQVVRLDAADLVFGPAELEQLAAGADRPVDSLAALGGWPALVRLALTAPIGAPRRYLWDEVISGLGADEREALIALGLLGRAGPATVAELTGRAVEVDELVSAVPLVDHHPDGTISCHQLWEDVTNRLADVDTVERIRAGTVAHLLDRGEINRAGLIAAKAADGSLLTRPVMTLIAGTLGAFPADTADRWIEAVGGRLPGHPAIDLLELGRRQARNVADPTLRDLIDRLVGRPETDPADEAVLLSLATIVAFARRDIPWMLRLVELGRRIDPEASNHNLRVTIAAVDAAAAELVGDAELGLDLLEMPGPPDQLGETATRLYLHLLLLTGRTGEAVPLAERRLSLSANPDVRAYTDFVRWSHGHPEPMMTSEGGALPSYGTNDWAGFAHLVLVAPICAAVGADRQLRQVMVELARFDPGEQAKDRAQLLVAQVASDVMSGDEDAAASRFERHLERFPLSDPSSTLHLRRFPAFGVVLVPELREAWADEPVGPSLRRNIEAGLALVAARSATLDVDEPLPSANQLMTSLPLPWSVELVGRAHLADHPDAPERFAQLVDLVGLADDAAVGHHRVHAQLDSLVQAGVLPAEACALETVTPRPPTSITRIELLGPMRILVDGVALERAELRRARVREVIGVLVVDGSISRDRLMEVVWADLDRAAAARNLRVTLTYVRKVLDGDEATGAHLRVDSKQVTLTRSTHLQSDLWELQRLRDALDEATAAGDPAAIETALAGLAAADGRDPLPDLRRLEPFEPLAERVTTWVTDAAVALGERRLAQGRAAEALDLAGAARAASPYSLAAGRLALAARLHEADGESLAGEIDQLRATLDDLGVPPDPSTAILLEQAERSLGRLTPATPE